VDHAGRVWAGLAKGGVSVFDGAAWHNYPDGQGPGSARVNKIAVAPDGAVWLATEGGLTRYSDQDGWRTLTQADGLPGDQFTGLAFNAAGDLFAASACDGLVVLRKANGYVAGVNRFQVVPGPVIQPNTPAGAGLPSPLLNDVAVDGGGVIWVATVFGVARSLDDGATWHYLRGKDWADDVSGSALGMHPKEVPVHVDLLTEDWVSTLAPTADGQIWLGFRAGGFETRSAAGADQLFTEADDPTARADGGEGDDVRAILPLGNGAALLGHYGGGVTVTAGGKRAAPGLPAGAGAGAVAPLPPAALAPELLMAEADRLSALVAAAAPAKAADPADAGGGSAAFYAMDWVTAGDWVGRMGGEWARIYAVSAAGDDEIPGTSPFFHFEETAGPHRQDTKYNGVYYYVDSLQSDNPNVIYDPKIGKRRPAEINDGSWQGIYPRSWEGPDHSNDGHSGPNRFRDFVIRIKPYTQDLGDADAETDLAHCRVRDFWNGGYSEFWVRGPGTYWIKVERNRSHVVKLQAILTDWAGTVPLAHGRIPTWPFMPPGDYREMPVPPPAGPEPGPVQAARQLWRAVDNAADVGLGAESARADRMLAYDAALAGGAPPELLTNWRRKLGIWQPGDYTEFDTTMAATALSWQAYQDADIKRQQAAKDAAKAAAVIPPATPAPAAP